VSRYAEIAVELPVPGTYHYAVPERLRGRAAVGARVLVPFGNRGVSGVVVGLGEEADPSLAEDKIRPISDLVDNAPLVDRDLLDLCLWVARYYEAAPGEVLRAALPAGTQISSAPYVRLTPAGLEAVGGGAATGALSRQQRDILGRVAAASGVVAQKKLLKGKVRRGDLVPLFEAGLLEATSERKKARVRARTVRVAVLDHAPTDDDRAALARSPRRREVLDALVAAGGRADVSVLNQAVPRASAHVRGLAGMGLVSVEEREVRRSGWADANEGATASAPAVPPRLTDAQREAVDAIGQAIERGSFEAFLLHGITGSGKTEVYLHAIGDVVAAGRSALVLVPEISLTPQLAARFRARFGDEVAVLHSGLSDGERFDEWHRLQRGAAHIALGARSAVFAPVRNLGIVVVDEEHDSSFKQEEGVRYSARDVALVRAQRASVPCVLGSATPSMESFRQAATGRYRLQSLPKRANARPLPSVELVDLREYRTDGESMLSAPLADAIEETLKAGDQVILFLNRRGFSTFVVCGQCGFSFRCKHCSVSLTYHRYKEELCCHYCGHSEPLTDRCPSCNAQAIIRKGLGTERIAAAVAERFPDARVSRLDRDTSGRMQGILAAVARRETDILVGTQMVTKGHDFPGVTLVGVLCADTGLSLPDFRASERTFQLLTQVAGRAGRGDRPGRVLVQTYRPDHPVLVAARTHDYDQFYRSESLGRSELGYPPFGHLVAVRIDGADARAVEKEAQRLGRRAASLAFGTSGAGEVEVLGPTEAPLARLKGRTRWHLWLRGPDRRKLRELQRAVVAAGGAGGGTAGVRVVIDVDPVSAL